MQKANDITAQLQTAAHAAATQQTTTATATTSTTDSAAATDTKEEVDLPKKDIPLPKNPGYEWVITKPEALDLLNTNKSEVIIYERKILEEANNSAKEKITSAGTAASSSAASNAANTNAAVAKVNSIETTTATGDATKDSKDIKDVKDLQEKQLVLSHIAIGNFKTESFNCNMKNWPACNFDIHPISIVLFFKNPDKQIKARLNHELINQILGLDAISSKLEWSAPMLACLNENSTNFISYVIAYQSKEDVGRFFHFWVEKGVLSKSDAEYFEKISGHRMISSAEQKNLDSITKALNIREYDKIILELEAIHKDGIKESEERGVLYGYSDSIEMDYFDPRSAAYEVGKKLLTLSPLHAVKAFSILTNGSPYLFNCYELLVSVSEEIISKKRSFPLPVTEEIVKFLSRSIMVTMHRNRPEIFIKGVNAIYELLEIQTDNARAQPGIPLFQTISNWKKTTLNLNSIIAGNFINIANRLYELNSKENSEKLIATENDSITKTNKQSPVSVNANETATSSTASAASITNQNNATNPMGDSNSSSDPVIDLKSSIELAATTHTSTSSSSSTLPALPKNWKLPEQSDWKKFTEDKTNKEFFVLERDCKVQSESEQKIGFSIYKLMLIRLQPTHPIYYDENGSARKVSGNPMISLVLFALDASLPPKAIASMPNDAIKQYFTSETDPDLWKLKYFESSDDLLFIARGENSLPLAPNPMGGTRILSFRIAAMREATAEKMLFAITPFLSVDEVNFIRELIRPLIKAIPPQESLLLQSIGANMAKAQSLHSLIMQPQKGPTSSPVSVAELTQQRNVILELIIKDVRAIHAVVIEDNRNNQFFDLYGLSKPSPLDDADIALQIGEAFALISPEHAHQALSIITSDSFYFRKVSELIGPISITLSASADSEKKRRFYREQALSFLFYSNQIGTFLQLLQIHAGYDFLKSKDLFSALKNKPSDIGTHLQALIILCRLLGECNRKILSSNSSTITAPTNPMLMTAYQAAIASGGTIVTSSATPSTTSPATAATAAISASSTANTKPPRSLEDSDDDEDNTPSLATAVGTKI